MISFSSFPVVGEYRQNSRLDHPKDASDDVYMDLDEDYSQIDEPRLTWPGEMLTSSHDYMR